MVTSSIDADELILENEKRSDEDTEDASEVEIEKKNAEFLGIKDQMYQDRLAQYSQQLQQLEDCILPSFLKKLKKLEQMYKDRLLMNEIVYETHTQLFEAQYSSEKETAIKEFEDKKIELKNNLINDLEYKKNQIENEQISMEFMGDTMAAKQMNTRKLRRRPNDPVPVPEKRAKISPVQLCSALDEQEVGHDMAIIDKIYKPKSIAPATPSNTRMSQIQDSVNDVLVEDGRICINKKWFTKDQYVVIETKDNIKFNAVITNINPEEIFVKKPSENFRIKILVSQLLKGQYTMKKKP